jgi:hypothetical protein
MKFIKVLPLIAVLLFLGVNAAFADDGGDGQPKLGAGGPGSPDCSSFQGSADASGNINSECEVMTGTETTIIFAVPDAESSINPNYLGLTCQAPQFLEVGWTLTQNIQTTINGTLVDECTLTAPTEATPQDLANAAAMSGSDPTDEPDCDWDDFILGIPAGCDITVTTQGNKPSQLFAPNASFDVAPSTQDLIPFPEPGTLALTLLGLGALGLASRKYRARATA